MDNSSLPRTHSCPLIDALRNLKKNFNTSTTRSPNAPIPRNRSPSVDSTDPRRRGRVLDDLITPKETRSLNKAFALSQYRKQNNPSSQSSQTRNRQAEVSFKLPLSEHNTSESDATLPLTQSTRTRTNTDTVTVPSIGISVTSKDHIPRRRRASSPHSSSSRLPKKRQSLDSIGLASTLHPGIGTLGSRFVETGIIHQDPSPLNEQTQSTSNSRNSTENTNRHTPSHPRTLSPARPRYNKDKPLPPVPIQPLFLKRIPKYNNKRKTWETTPAS